MQLRKNELFANRYKLEDLLGEGGFSEVWRAKDTLTELTVALKVYACSKVDDMGYNAFSSEFSLVFNLQHNNLLKPTFFDIYNQRPYLVLPFCKSGSINKMIGKVREADAWQIMHDVAAALEYLHGQEPPLIHQDIKPGNIMFGDKGQYLLTDFGISIKARNTSQKDFVGDFDSIGTLAYMGPERFCENPFPIKASDIFSLGATMFELISGTVPFGEHGGILLQKGSEIPNLKGFCSKKLEYIILKCLEKETWNRPTAETVKSYCEQYITENISHIPIPDINENNEYNMKWNDLVYKNNSKKTNTFKYVLIGISALLLFLIAGFIFSLRPVLNQKADLTDELSDSLSDKQTAESVEDQRVEELYSNYIQYIEKGDNFVLQGDIIETDGFELFYLEAKDIYNLAIEYRKKHDIELNTYPDIDIQSKIKTVESKIDSVIYVFVEYAKISQDTEKLKAISNRNYALRDSFFKRAERLNPEIYNKYK